MGSRSRQGVAHARESFTQAISAVKLKGSGLRDYARPENKATSDRKLSAPAAKHKLSATGRNACKKPKTKLPV